MTPKKTLLLVDGSVQPVQGIEIDLKFDASR
jgi:hypothetical protein